MVNWDTLILGLIFFVLGLIGLVIKSNVKEDQKYSLTGTQVTIGTYALLVCGTGLIILSFLSSD